MSDYISNDQTNAIFFNSFYDNNSCPSLKRYSGQLNNNVRLFDEEVELNAQDKVSNQYEGTTRFYQQRNMFGPDSALNDGNSLSESVYNSHAGEMQRLSSDLIRLLSEIRQNTSKRPQHEQRTRDQHNFGATRCRRTEAPRRTRPAHDGSFVAHEGSAPVGDNSNHNVASSISAVSFSNKASMTGEIQKKEFLTSSSDTLKRDKERDRLKKDTHNKSERRRRTFIDDRITELRNLLPEHIDRLSCQKKISVLMESIDYIKKLIKDQDRVHRLEDEMREAFLEINKLAIRLEQLEFHATNTVANSGGTYQMHDLTSEKPNFNNCFTVPQPNNTQLKPCEIIGRIY